MNRNVLGLFICLFQMSFLFFLSSFLNKKGDLPQSFPRANETFFKEPHPAEEWVVPSDEAVDQMPIGGKPPSLSRGDTGPGDRTRGRADKITKLIARWIFNLCSIRAILQLRQPE